MCAKSKSLKGPGQSVDEAGFLSESNTIVCDVGSGSIRIGYAGQVRPRRIIPSIVGRLKSVFGVFKAGYKKVYIGDEAVKYGSMLNLTYPVTYAIVNDFDHLSQLWELGFKSIGAISEENDRDLRGKNLIVTECPVNVRANREVLLEIAMETFGVSGFYLGNQSVFSMYSTGVVTGLIVDSGEMTTFIVPIVNGNCLSYAVTAILMGGRDLTAYMAKLFAIQGYSFNTFSELNVVNKIKEGLGYVATDFEVETRLVDDGAKYIKEKYTLPDGKSIMVNDERFQCPEAMFDTNRVGLSELNLIDGIIESLMKCDVKERLALINNIVVCGGNCLFKGIEQRISNDLKKKLIDLPEFKELKVWAPSDRHLLSWKGASLLGSVPHFSPMLIKNEEYREIGPSIVHQKCI